MKRKTSRKPNPETAGIEYATAQLESDYFMDWVRDQLAEAADMDPNDVLPLETKQDARVIAKNMLQQLEWDMKRDLISDERVSKEFFDGFHRGLTNPSTVDWLADELLELKGQMRGGGVSEAGSRPRMTESTDAAYGEFWVLDHAGRPIAGPFTTRDAAEREMRRVKGMQVTFAPKGSLKVRDYIAVDRRDRPVGPRHGERPPNS